MAEKLSGIRVALPEEDICSNRLVYMDLVLLMQSSGVKMRPSGVGTPNAVGVGELYHGYLWTMFQRDLADDRAAPTNKALFLAV
eukprot:contig_20411_g5028